MLGPGLLVGLLSVSFKTTKSGTNSSLIPKILIMGAIAWFGPGCFGSGGLAQRLFLALPSFVQ